MLSPAKAHFQRTLAAMSSGRPERGPPPMPQTGPVASEYQLLLAALGQDLATLRNTQSTERKIEAKRGMIAKFLPWVEGAADAGAGAQDEIVSTMLVWAIDVQDWPLALKLAAYVLRAGIALPERYKRTPATLVAEEVAEIGVKTPGAVPLQVLQSVAHLVEDEDIFDQVRAKLEKALGLAFQAQAAAFEPGAETAVAGGKPALLATAKAHFERALSLDGKCGVRKLIEGLGRELKKLEGQAA
ncbi:phage terminase small subunit [Novosphingobium beihaiensis]|uniref:Phage terminase small subunit n=1 Tax=Novosphingobium beihaiensis TaxID=2930389 RepID=A0ABT0BVX1_9SPHN|nr:phage terminase small subunit [Novosphingobium beihaiensis]MCJ2189157.1 phage terminase small subunit [Novosphingobium beihaiensis]